MKKLLFILAVLFSVNSVRGQFIYKIKADSVLITNDSCTAELIIENSTKSVKGFLVNKGNGRTEFRRATQLTDSSFVVAGDTIVIRGIASGLFAINPARMGQIGKNKFTVFASCIVRLQKGSVVSGSIYNIDYSLLDESDGHDHHFFTSANSNSDQNVYVNFPRVKYVHYGIMIPDEKFSSAGIQFGTGVNFTNMQSLMTANVHPSYLVKLSDVTSTPTNISGVSLMQISKSAGGLFTFSDPYANGASGSALMGTEVTSSILKLRIKSTPAYIQFENDATIGLPNLQFTIRDAFGNIINDFDNSNTGDFLQISDPAHNEIVVDSRYWRESSMNKLFISGGILNIWCFGIFEVYLLCSPVTSSEVLAEWQPYTGATDYQLYRSTTDDFSGETQVYTGTALSFLDTGLSSNTKYWYRLKGTVSGSANTVITSFDTKTNP